MKNPLLISSNMFYLKEKSLKLAYINQVIKHMVQNFHTPKEIPRLG